MIKDESGIAIAVVIGLCVTWVAFMVGIFWLLTAPVEIEARCRIADWEQLPGDLAWGSDRDIKMLPQDAECTMLVRAPAYVLLMVSQ